MGNMLLMFSCASLVAGSLCLAFSGGPLDWILAAAFAVRLGITTKLLHIIIPGLISVFIIHFQIHQTLASLFDNSKAEGTEAGRPVLFKCRTRHRWIFPEKDAFDYLCLLAGVPVGLKGRNGGIFAAEKLAVKECEGRSAWFEVRAEDHLHRGSGELGLRGKLEAYLVSEGIDPAKYPYAYLITAPRFFGYFLNPTSYWYLYDEDRALGAVVFEVNNSFGERRVYFVSGNEPRKKLGHSTPAPELGDDSDTQQDPNLRYKFWESVSKDFHVSAFSSLSSRERPCSVETNDPLGPGLEGFSPLDVTATISSSKGHPKDVIKLFSLGDPLDPAKMTALEKLRLILGLGWEGLLAVPHIVREAGALWLHGFHVWLGHESLRGTINRRATTSETFLEGVFRAYLQYLIDQSAKALVVKYVPSGTDWGPEVMRSPRARNGEAAGELEFQVLTPAFYTRFVHYAHDFEAVLAEFRESSTISVLNPELLPDLLLKKPPPSVSTGSFADYLYFRAIRWLRRRPPRMSPPSQPRDAPPGNTAGPVDIRELRLSSMDGYVLAEAPAEERRRYRAVVARALLVSQASLGSPEVLWVGEAIVRAGVIWLFIIASQSVLNRFFSF